MAAPVHGALISLEPGRHITQTDSMGVFQFSNIRRGSYLVRVQTIGFVEVQDSVVYGEHGVEVLAALAPYQPGLLACVRPAVR